MTKTMDSSKMPTTSRTNEARDVQSLHCPVCARWCLNFKGVLGYLEVRCKNKHWFCVRDGVVKALLASDVQP